MFVEKRHNEAPIPDHVAACINVDQLAMLHTIESFGWTLKYIRDSESSNPTVIVAGPNGQDYGLLEKDGTLNKDCYISIRL